MSASHTLTHTLTHPLTHRHTPPCTPVFTHTESLLTRWERVGRRRRWQWEHSNRQAQRVVTAMRLLQRGDHTLPAGGESLRLSPPLSDALSYCDVCVTCVCAVCSCVSSSPPHCLHTGPSADDIRAAAAVLGESAERGVREATKNA